MAAMAGIFFQGGGGGGNKIAGGVSVRLPTPNLEHE